MNIEQPRKPLIKSVQFIVILVVAILALVAGVLLYLSVDVEKKQELKIKYHELLSKLKRAFDKFRAEEESDDELS